MTQQFVNSYVLGFQEIDQTKLMMAGGKGANLGELSRIEGIRVPEGFCVTTEAYKKLTENNLELNGYLNELSHLGMDDREKIGEVSKKARTLIERISISRDIEEEITCYLAKLGEKDAYAVRSSATAEDLPLASFAGQLDTYLNIIGKSAILQHISKCWASLFTERAVAYRIQNGFDPRKVYLSVVIQKMVFPQAAGILFTADPVTSNRRVASIDASFGLGEALVSGLVNADIYKVQEGKIVEKKISTKKLAIYALKEGGTQQQQPEPDQQNMRTLTDEQILQLEKTGRRIEAYFGRPQDIEWCLDEGEFYIVQSRPITTLYPVPNVNDGKKHVFMSLSHQQLMTDPIRPLGISFFLIGLSKLAGQGLGEAGGRVYMDVSSELASPTGRKIFVDTGLGSTDILIHNALTNVLKRKDFMKLLPHGRISTGLTGGTMGQMLNGLIQAIKIYRQNDAYLIQKLIAKNEAQVRDADQKLKSLSGDGLFDFILQDMDQMYKTIVLDNYGVGIIFTIASSWLKSNLKKWLDDTNATDILYQALSNNVTAEMGLDLLDVADVVRQYPAVMGYFQHASDDTFFGDLAKLEGGGIAVSDCMQSYLRKYGVRCPGEIDITRTRWAEKSIPLILNNIKNFEPGSHKLLFEQKRSEAVQKERELISRIEKLPGGKRKAKSTKKWISVYRNFIGFREYPKYGFMQHYYVYKQALLREGAKLVQKGVIREAEDIYYLTFEELRKVVSTNRLDIASSRSAKRTTRSMRN